jgi:hypothetical protein
VTDLFTPDPDADDAPAADRRCTPELLLAFLRTLHRPATLADLRHEFGGILGPLLDAWTLRRAGRLPPAPRPGRRRGLTRG